MTERGGEEDLERVVGRVEAYVEERSEEEDGPRVRRRVVLGIAHSVAEREMRCLLLGAVAIAVVGEGLRQHACFSGFSEQKCWCGRKSARCSKGHVGNILLQMELDKLARKTGKKFGEQSFVSKMLGSMCRRTPINIKKIWI